MNNRKSKILTALFLIIFSIISLAQNGPNLITALNINEGKTIYLEDGWKFSNGDNSNWKEPAFNDSGWATVNSRMLASNISDYKWEGIGWFRLTVDVDSTLVNVPLALTVYQAGASEIYLNGKIVKMFGKVSAEKENEIIAENWNPLIITFPKAESNLIAVRYSNHHSDEFINYDFRTGFTLALTNSNVAIERRVESQLYVAKRQMFFITAPLVLALLHLFLFIFDPRSKSNLYYVASLIFFSAFIFINTQTAFVTSRTETLIYFRLGHITLIFTLFFISTSVITIFSKLPKYFFLFPIAGVLIGIYGFFFPEHYVWYITYAFIVSISWYAGRAIFTKRLDGLGGETIIRTGFIITSIAGILQMFTSMDLIEPLFGIQSIYYYGVLIFILSMSISLARDFVQTNKILERKLEEVEQLSQKTLKQELEAKELETEKRILAADNERKTKELEEARKVQLSMLPQNLPEIPGLQIGVFMETATEVGGDYYDFNLGKDGTLNVVIGDATGHGMKAGIMVATIKSLFGALGNNLMIGDFFQRCTQIIKNMKLGNLFMSLSILRIKNNYAILSSAGMPPTLVFRSAKNEVEEIVIKGMPLGAFNKFEYNEIELEISDGDIILLLTDGIEETFNRDKEMFGSERIKEILKQSADKAPEELIDILNVKAKQWRQGLPQADDITFVVLKYAQN